MYDEEEQQEENQGVYGDEGRENLMKDDEISPEEEAFMSGYDLEDEKKKEEDDDPYEKAFDEASAAGRGKGKKNNAKKIVGKQNKSVKPKKTLPVKKKIIPAKKAPALKKAPKKDVKKAKSKPVKAKKKKR